MQVEAQRSVPMMDEVGIYAEGLREGSYHKLVGVRSLYFAGFEGILQLQPEYGEQGNLLGFRVKPYQGKISTSSLMSSTGTQEVTVGMGDEAYKWMVRS